MFFIDYFLYLLYASRPDRQIPDMRVRRRDEAVEWLKEIQAGKVDPSLPTIDTELTTDVNNPFKWGSNKRVNTSW
ncbi:MAG: DUF1320 family protein [Bacteroidales bacterium]|nr:DUF1320 family protein [Bacteroidales bacterium]